MENKQTHTHMIANLLGLIGISFILLTAYYQQYVYHELPCPLCLLQRTAFIGVGIGFIFNLTLSCRPAHYGLIILSAITGLMIALRQIFLHVSPSDPGFSSPFMGLHLYTWAALIFLSIIIFSAIGLLFDKGFHSIQKNGLIKGVVLFFFLIISVDCISSFLECGFSACPDDPTHYQLLN